MKKIHDVILIFVFSLAVFLMPFLFVFSEKDGVSYSERRALKSLPELTADKLFAGAYSEELGSYLADNLPAREKLRKIKAFFHTGVLGVKENDSIAVVDGCAAKIIKKISAASLSNVVAKWRGVYYRHIAGKNVRGYISVIPDKSYFFARDLGYPSSKCESAVASVCAALPELKYIDVFPCVCLSDYYKTDTHIAQEKAGNIISALLSEMGANESDVTHTVRKSCDFYGVYRGQAALPLEADELNYVTSAVIDNCTVFDHDSGEYIPMYDLKAAHGRDGYEMFLGGSVGIAVIENAAAENDRRLVVFRDSFGSALCPLLAEGYKSVTAIDLRYSSDDEIDKAVDFDGCDVLFLYSVHTLENSYQMK